MNRMKELREKRALAQTELETIAKKADLEKRARTAEEKTAAESLLDKIEALDKEIATEERMAKVIEDGNKVNKPSNPVDPSAHPATAADAPIYRGSNAATLGQQLLDIRTSSRGDGSKEYMEARSRLEQSQKREEIRMAAIAHKENRAAGTGGFVSTIPSDGGFFLQGETSVDLMTNGFNNSEVLSRCQSRTLGPGTQFVEIIGIDETSRATGSRGGGVTVYTTAELDALTQTKTKFRKVRIEPKKLTGLYYASNEILANVTFLGQEMRSLFGEEFAFKAQDLIIRGTGAGEPLGILNAPALVTQAKETNQTAATIVTENVLKMESRLSSEAGNIVYLVNRETKPQLSVLSIAIGTGGALVPLYQTAYYEGKRTATLNGFPCVTIEQASALGTPGDIILADLSQYITANKGDINEAMSIHVYFLYDQSAFRFIWYFDGQPRWASAITPYKGSATVSAFVDLAVRA